MAAVVPLGEHEQVGKNPAMQLQIFKSDYETAVATTLAVPRNVHFSDAKVKTPQCMERDRERADRIEQMATHLRKQAGGSADQDDRQYAAAQPNTNPEDVIAGFLLTDARTQVDQACQGYQPSRDKCEAAYCTFMENMDAWKRATDKAQAELDREKADLERRHRELDDSNSR